MHFLIYSQQIPYGWGIFIRMQAILSSVENAECCWMQAEKGRREKIHSFEHTNIEGN